MLKEKFDKEIRPALAKELGGNLLAAPTIEKVVVNVSSRDAVSDAKVIDELGKNLAQVTGQKPVARLAKIAIAGFKLREGQPIGIAVTLRGERMWSFLDRLINVVLPRVRDFRGLPDSFDGNGNYTLGLREISVFPEIDLGKTKSHGLEVTIKTTTREDSIAKKLLLALGLPIRREKEQMAEVKSG